MMQRIKRLLVAITTMVLMSCSVKVSQYQQSTPKFDVKDYFTGSMIAWGMVQDYRNQVTRRFCVELEGTWQGNEGLLAEKFYFNDGEISYRNWQLTKLENDRYQGQAEDVIGIAKGQQVGFAFQWQYTLVVPIDDTSYEFFLDDWMYQIDEHRVFNRTVMKKLGVEVAQITLFFDKQTPIKSCISNAIAGS